MEKIDSGSVLGMVDASAADLLRELNEKRTRSRHMPVVLLFGFPLLASVLLSGSPGLVAGAALVVIGATVWLTATRDVLRKTTVVFYDMEPQVERAYRAVHDAFDRLASCRGTWHLSAEGRVKDHKHHGGADAVVQRSRITLRSGDPPLVKTNVAVPLIPVGRQVLAFMPDRLLVFDRTGVGAVPYADLQATIAEQRFIERDALPSDAAVVGKTWEYVNKKGGPDRRFKNNRELPICAYELLAFSSSSGLKEVIQISRQGVAAELAAGLRTLAGSQTSQYE
jgi:hypothetical protein